jgi:hypothetical protein
VSQKGTLFLFALSSFLLLLQKKRTKEKESGKDNLALFFRPQHKAILALSKSLSKIAARNNQRILVTVWNHFTVSQKHTVLVFFEKLK